MFATGPTAGQNSHDGLVEEMRIARNSDVSLPQQNFAEGLWQFSNQIILISTWPKRYGQAHSWCCHSLPDWSNGLFCSSPHPSVKGEAAARVAPVRKAQRSPGTSHRTWFWPALSPWESTSQVDLYIVLPGFWVKAFFTRVYNSTCSPQTGFLWESSSYHLNPGQLFFPFWSAYCSLFMVNSRMGTTLHTFPKSYFGNNRILSSPLCREGSVVIPTGL